MKVVILQPSYIPWRGYFHQIAKADVFVFFDDVQYDARGWRNRNRIKTCQGAQWLTIPVHSAGAQTDHIPINRIRVCQETPWAEIHLRAIYHAYHRAPYFNQVCPLLESHYRRRIERLSDFTIPLTIDLAAALGIRPPSYLCASEIVGATGRKTDRLIAILKAVGGTHYITGPSARDYIEEAKLHAAGITIEYMTYEYPEYPQLHPPFDPQVSILDLLFMTGPDALSYVLASDTARVAQVTCERQEGAKAWQP